MFGSIKKILNLGRKKPEIIRTREDVDYDLDSLISSLKARLNQFLITRNAPPGEIKATKNWKLSKNSRGLFRLENDSISVLINTEPFLAVKNGKITGLIRMPEVSLCRLISDHTDVLDFFSMAEPLRSEYTSLLQDFTRTEPEFPGIDDLEHWEVFDLYQMIARNSPNTLVHVLLHASDQSRKKIQEQLSLRKKEILILEMKSLQSGGSAAGMNPHSRNRPLLEYEDALLEFRRKMRDYLHEKQLKDRKKLQHSGPVENSEHES
ncbi:MAG: hypothetical protein OEZ34_00390 [Spirochaetia bacterium]|nr:hypothetical protein [Spirochaetia bacterium]